MSIREKWLAGAVAVCGAVLVFAWVSPRRQDEPPVAAKAAEKAAPVLAPPMPKPHSAAMGKKLRAAELIRSMALQEKIVAGEFSSADQRALLEKLRREGMDPDEWEKIVQLFAGLSKDPAYRLEMANLLEAGAMRTNVLHAAFQLATPETLPLFTAALEGVHQDELRADLITVAVNHMLNEKTLEAGLDWVKSLATGATRESYIDIVARQAAGYIRDGDAGHLIPYGELTAHFTSAELATVGQGCAVVYLKRDDMSSLTQVYDYYPPEQRGLLMLTLVDNPSTRITAEQAVPIKDWLTADLRDRAGLMKQLVAKVQASGGDEAATAFVRDHLTAAERGLLQP